VEIEPNADEFRLKLPENLAAYEVGGTGSRKYSIEWPEHHPVDPGCEKKAEFFLRGRKFSEEAFRVEDSSRRMIERKDHGGEPLLAGLPDQLREQCPVPEVESVEGPEPKNARADVAGS